jgi:hypothetical protein
VRSLVRARSVFFSWKHSVPTLTIICSLAAADRAQPEPALPSVFWTQPNARKLVPARAPRRVACTRRRARVRRQRASPRVA